MIGEKIKNKRKELNLTQEYLAKELNISRQAVSKWEKGLSEPSMDNLVKLSEIFGVDIDYFKKDEGEDKSPISNIFWDFLYAAIGLIFYLLYYFGIMEGGLKQGSKANAIFNTYCFSSYFSDSFPPSCKKYGRQIR